MTPDASPADSSASPAGAAADSTAAPVRAAPDSIPAPSGAATVRDTASGARAPAYGEARPPAPPRRGERPPDPPFSSPRWVMLRSAVFPGWGQAYNHAWWKAGVIAAVEAGLMVRIYDDNRVLDDLDAQASAAEAAGDDVLQNELALRYNDRLDRMVSRQWLLGGVIAYALLDAYVDAHFRGFDIEFKTDPALPGDAPASAGVQAGLRWSF